METLLVAAALIGCAVNGGIFFAFSSFIMRALARVPEEHGMAAMQAINVTVLNPGFFAFFFGTAALCVGTLIVAFRTEGGPSPALVAGSVLYLAGCIGVTIAGNIPLNDRLERVGEDRAANVDVWRLYLRRWTFWNHVRTAACLAGAAAFAVALAGA